jgi:dihydrofolate reductase
MSNGIANLHAIIATTGDGLLGCEHGLPWQCKPDLVHFRNLTTGNIVVFGYKTFKDLYLKWAGDVVLLGRDIVVVYEVDKIKGSVEDAQHMFDFMGAKQLGGRFLKVPIVSDELIRNERLHELTLGLAAHDIELFKQPGQLAYIAGGAKTYDMFAPYIDQYDWTVIFDFDVTRAKGTQLVHLASDGPTWSRLKTWKRVGKLVESHDSSSHVGCRFYTLKKSNT